MSVNGKSFVNFSAKNIKDTATTMALGEEGGNSGSSAAKKTDKSESLFTSGNESANNDKGTTYTTMALGEEGGNNSVSA